MMEQCEFCGASLPAGARFCGKCGQVPRRISQQATHVGDLPTLHLENPPDENAETILSASGKHMVPRPVTLVPLEEEIDKDLEEEKRRRAALLGLTLPLVGELADQPPPGQVPTIQGTPQVGHIPTISGSPQMQAGSIANPPLNPGSPAIHGTSPPFQPPTPLHPPYHPPPYTPPGHPGGSPGGSTGGSTGGSAGCLTIGAIIAAAVLIILSTFIGLGLTVWAPGLSLSGSSSVAPGATMTLHGSSFLPNSSVTLTLDNGTPLYLLQRPAPTQLAANNGQLAASAGLLLQTSLQPTAQNVISASGNGSFTVKIFVNPAWSAGKHTIHASESLSHRSASLSFIIASASVTTTATATATDAPAPTATGTATPTPTPTAAPGAAPTLSCATPGNLALGPVSEFSSQTASNTVTLCTSGTGTLTWKASWDQNQAPWLNINQGSGTIQAPNQTQVTLSASPANLAAGTYTATVTFIGVESNTTQAVNVTLTVKAGCVQATPPRMSFVGVQDTSNPPPQTISITNCGLTSGWSASVTQGSTWLSISPSNGTLNGGATGTITVTASNLRFSLKPGTYNGSISIKIGSKTATVVVILTVQPPPTISVSPTSLFFATQPCTNDPNTGIQSCIVTLTNSSSTANLTWSWLTNGSGVKVEATSTTIPAGGQETVTIVFSVCNNIAVTFTGPGNSATVNYNCSPIQ
jgi:hypothetical protein